MNCQQLSLFLLFLVTIVIISVPNTITITSGQTEQQAQKWLTFDRTNYGFKVQYPAYPDLIIRERAGSVIFEKLGNLSNIHDDVIISVNIIKGKDKNNNENLDHFASNITNRIPTSYKVSELEKNATLSGMP